MFDVTSVYFLLRLMQLAPVHCGEKLPTRTCVCVCVCVRTCKPSRLSSLSPLRVPEAFFLHVHPPAAGKVTQVHKSFFFSTVGEAKDTPASRASFSAETRSQACSWSSFVSFLQTLYCTYLHTYLQILHPTNPTYTTILQPYNPA